MQTVLKVFLCHKGRRAYFSASPLPPRSIHSNYGQGFFDARLASDAPIRVQNAAPVLSLPRAKAGHHCQGRAPRLGMGQSIHAALLGISGQDRQKFCCYHQGTRGGLGRNGAYLPSARRRFLSMLIRQHVLTLEIRLTTFDADLHILPYLAWS